MVSFKKILPAALIMLMFLITACAAGRSGQEPTSTQKPPIDLSLKDLDGNAVHLRDLRGMVVLLNYWASWCSPCREEMPLLNAYYEDHKSEGFVLISVNASESPQVAASFINEHGFSFPVWSDPPGNSMIEFGLSGLPASMLLDRDGRLRKVWLGPLTQEMLDESVLPLPTTQ